MANITQVVAYNSTTRRFYATSSSDKISIVLNDIRLIPNVNIYDDSETITVPSLPLTAI